MDTEYKPLIDKDIIVLYDIFINGIWVGSRTTIEQAKSYAQYLISYK